MLAGRTSANTSPCARRRLPVRDVGQVGARSNDVLRTRPRLGERRQDDLEHAPGLREGVRRRIATVGHDRGGPGHHHVVTLDHRALPTYQRLGAAFSVIG